MKKPYYVAEDILPYNTALRWAVIRRANDSNGNVVCHHTSRQKARECMWQRFRQPDATCQAETQGERR